MSSTGWIIAASVGGSFIVLVICFRCLFVHKRAYVQRNKEAEVFGTMGPNAIHQKVRQPRQRQFVAAVLTPGSRLNCGIRKEKKSFNFITHFAMNNYDLDELDDEEDADLENQLNHGVLEPPQKLYNRSRTQPGSIDEDVNVNAKQQHLPDLQQQTSRLHNSVISLLCAAACPCLRSRFRITTIDDDLLLHNLDDLESVDSAEAANAEAVCADLKKSKWRSKLSSDSALHRRFGSQKYKKDVAAKKLEAQGSETDEKKKKKKKIKKPKKIYKALSTKDRVNKFLEHMRAKSSKKLAKQKSLYGPSLSVSMSQSLESESQSGGESASNMNSARVADDEERYEEDAERALFGEAGRLRDDVNYVSIENNPETDFVEDFMFTDMSSNSINAANMAAELDVSGNYDSSQLFGLTVGYHTTVSNNFNGTLRSLSQFTSSYGVEFHYSPRVNSGLAAQRVARRIQTKRILRNEYGIEDVVYMNAGPPLEKIPLGYEVDGSVQSMDDRQISSQWCMYLFNEANDKILVSKAGAAPEAQPTSQFTDANGNIRGWYIGYLLGPSMRGPGNYHIRFEVLHTKTLKLDGLYKLDLDLAGKNAYGRKWVIIKPSVELQGLQR
jgi:hypothetical protein